MKAATMTLLLVFGIIAAATIYLIARAAISVFNDLMISLEQDYDD